MIYKKILKIALAALIALALVVPYAALADNIKVTINGNNVAFDQPPVIVDGRTLVPLRAIFEAMGCTVLWDGTSQIASVATKFGMMTFGIGSNYISYRNENEDRSVFADVPPQIIGGRTMVPVRAIAECTGYNVSWDGDTRTVVITGDIEGLSTPHADIPGYYNGTQTPDFGACLGIPLANHATDSEYTYNGVTGHNVSDYIETYLVSAGFLIDDEFEAFGMFVFMLSNEKTLESVKVSYFKSDKTLIITLIKG
ncbi:MAG: copper amine oxidase N-terminal domain-containing protein [Clostridia bacterium]|nr:copper amine oxidase N-terminal domain-containing protein [Clostridia bacterium]